MHERANTQPVEHILALSRGGHSRNGAQFLKLQHCQLEGGFPKFKIMFQWFLVMCNLFDWLLKSEQKCS